MKTVTLKTVVRAAALFCAGLLVLPLCVGCGKEEPPADTSSAEEETEPAAPEPVDIVSGGEIIYSLIRADSAGDSLKSAYKTLAAAFHGKGQAAFAHTLEFFHQLHGKIVRPERRERNSDAPRLTKLHQPVTHHSEMPVIT